MATAKINNFFTAVLLSTAVLPFSAFGREIDTNTARLQAMDKITGKVSVLDAPINSEVKFGSFSIVVRSCKTRSPEETPENFAYVDVVDSYGEEPLNIFRGWMLSSSPALNPVAHPIYDVWLLKCVDTNVDKAPKLSAEDLKKRENIKKRESNERPSVKKEDESKEIEETTSEEAQDISLPENEDVLKEENNLALEAAKELEKLKEPSSVSVDDDAPKALINIQNNAESFSSSDVYQPKKKEVEAPSEFLVIKKDERPAPIQEPESSSKEDIMPEESDEIPSEPLTPKEQEEMLPELLENAKPISTDELSETPVREDKGLTDIPLLSSSNEEKEVEENQLIAIDEDDEASNLDEVVF